ncbi:hypothetical protein AVEN_43520-1 [Araneus ventricosus]|uniref:Uncharacterized protein n=1 Tax=Araneus ventricosus TaxID=182803 RepID=A0A4Y2J7S2_ARAVE|nr:hypothetical protein AVEN_43520-1 [Araneus ventricosus]
MVMQEDDTITQHARAIVRRMASRWPNDYFLFQKLKEYLSGTRVPNLGNRLEAPVFPPELSQQFLSFASIMGIVMQEDDTITQHARAIVRRMASRWPSDYFLSQKLKEHLSGRKFSSETDVKTILENWFNVQDVSFAKSG